MTYTAQTLVPGSTPVIPSRSPFAIASLGDLYLQPTSFFRGDVDLGRARNLLIVTLTCGAAGAIDRLGEQVWKVELGARVSNLEALRQVAGSWLAFWAFTLLAGAMGAALVWLLGGWWYKVRLRWAGAADPDPRQARVVYVYSSFVLALPAVLTLVMATVLYESYVAYWRSSEIFSALLVVFVFWSVVTGYKGARACFPVSRWRARLWFLVLPCLLYLGAIAVAVLLQPLVGGTCPGW